jgi:RNA polymerase sigma-70 factor (ECF subfamily)
MEQLSQRQLRFQQLTRPWRDRLLGVALRRADSLITAEDWVQEALLRAWRDRDCLNDEVAVYAWLLKILDHVIADNIRREARRHQLAPVVTTEDTFLQEHPSAAIGPFEQVLQQQTDEQVTAAIKSLPDEFCSVILLRDIEGLSYKEVADILGIPQGTVMSRLSRGRRLLCTVIIKQLGVGVLCDKSINNTRRN